MAEAQLTNAVSLADSPIHKRRPGRPPGSRKKDEAEIKPIAMPSFLQKEKRPRGRPRIHPPKDPLAEKRPRGRPKTTPDGVKISASPMNHQLKIQQLQHELQAKDEEIAALKRKLEELESVLQQNTAVKATNGTQPPVYVRMANDESLQHVRFLTMPPPPAHDEPYVLKDKHMEEVDEEDPEDMDEDEDRSSTNSSMSSSALYDQNKATTSDSDRYSNCVRMGATGGHHGSMKLQTYPIHNRHSSGDQQVPAKSTGMKIPIIPPGHQRGVNNNRFQDSVPSVGRVQHQASSPAATANQNYASHVGSNHGNHYPLTVPTPSGNAQVVGNTSYLQSKNVEDLYTSKYIPRGVHYPHSPVKYNSSQTLT